MLGSRGGIFSVHGPGQGAKLDVLIFVKINVETPTAKHEILVTYIKIANGIISDGGETLCQDVLYFQNAINVSQPKHSLYVILYTCIKIVRPSLHRFSRTIKIVAVLSAYFLSI
jgi:hypothetical protein